MRGTAWLSLLLYVVSEGAAAKKRMTGRWLLSAAGCVALLAHIAFAFHYQYQWSHSAALLETARQTAALTGFNSGSGIYVNYAFATIWIADVMGSWRRRNDPEPLSRRWVVFRRAFFLFMFFNATFVFVPHSTRWLGLVCCVVLVVLWAAQRSEGRTARSA